jgi:hypothetical protein
MTFIAVAITGFVGGAVYAYLFIQSYPQKLRQAGHLKRMINLVSRFFLIGGIFWYLLHLDLTARILFLVVFIGSFWCCIIVTQRRYYERN